MLHALFADRGFDLAFAGSSLQSQPYLGPMVGPQHIPAFRLAARLAHFCSPVIIRVNLHGKLILRKQKFDQEWKAGCIRGRIAQKAFAELLRQTGKSPASKRAIGDGTVVAREPCLADWPSRNFTGVKGFKVASTPDALVKLRLQQ